MILSRTSLGMANLHLFHFQRWTFHSPFSSIASAGWNFVYLGRWQKKSQGVQLPLRHHQETDYEPSPLQSEGLYFSTFSKASAIRRVSRLSTANAPAWDRYFHAISKSSVRSMG